jgi:hypothetical protein
MAVFSLNPRTVKSIFQLPMTQVENSHAVAVPTILIFRMGRPIGHLYKDGRAAPIERWVAIGQDGQKERHASRRAAIRCLEGWAKRAR